MVLIIPAMIPKKLLLPSIAFLTFALLVACEPLAPDQTPRYVIVTGETPEDGAAPSTSPLAVTPELAEGLVPTLAGESAVNVGGAIASPVPVETPTEAPTAIPSATPFVCTESAGRVIRSTFYSAVAGTDVAYYMYQPPCFYDTFQRYPYVILLHGTGYDEAMWVDLGAPTVLDQGILKGVLPPMVLIMPDGGVLSELNDRPDGTSYESLLLDELVPSVEDEFCLWGSRTGRAIGGISRGGFWAFSIALRYPDLFSAVGGHSAYFDPDNALPQYNPLDLAQTAPLLKFPLRIYMDNGADDVVGTNMLALSEILSARGIKHEYLVALEGGHDMDYWSAHMPDYLAFYGQNWPRNIQQLPSCLAPNPG
jgi:enterochelin esterase-like enzyme